MRHRASAVRYVVAPCALSWLLASCAAEPASPAWESGQPYGGDSARSPIESAEDPFNPVVASEDERATIIASVEAASAEPAQNYICLADALPANWLIVGIFFNPACPPVTLGSIAPNSFATVRGPSDGLVMCPFLTAAKRGGVVAVPTGYSVSQFFYGPQCDPNGPRTPPQPSNTWRLRCEGSTCPPPDPANFAVTNAASFGASAVLPPGSFVFGVATDSLAVGFARTGVASDVVAPSAACAQLLGDRYVSVVDHRGIARRACLLYVGPFQVNFQIPRDTAPHLDAARGATVHLVRYSDDVTVARGTVPVRAISPGFFTATGDGRGRPAMNVLRVREGVLTYEDAAQPIDLGPEGDEVFLALYGTGLRNRLRETDVTASLEGRTADGRTVTMALPVLFSGAQPDYRGVDQVNVRLPRELVAEGVHGDTRLVVRVDDPVNAKDPVANPLTVTLR